MFRPYNEKFVVKLRIIHSHHLFFPHESTPITKKADFG